MKTNAFKEWKDSSWLKNSQEKDDHANVIDFKWLNHMLRYDKQLNYL